MTWREYDLTTHSEILAQRPPPPLTRTCTRKHQLFHSPLSCPCPPPHTLHTRSVPFPHSSPPNLLLILHSLQHSCQAVMFFLASPTQCSHRFPLPLHTATSHTPWAQLTHWERRWESFGWAVTPSQRDTQCDCFTKKTTAGNVNVIPLSAALLSVNWKKTKKLEKVSFPGFDPSASPHFCSLCCVLMFAAALSRPWSCGVDRMWCRIHSSPQRQRETQL